MTKLRVAPDLALPLDTATSTLLTGGTPARYVGKLTTLNFAEIPSPGTLRASYLFFPEGA